MFRLNDRYTTHSTFRGTSISGSDNLDTVPLSETIEYYKPTTETTSENLKKPFIQLDSKLNNLISQLSENGIYLNDEANN